MRGCQNSAESGIVIGLADCTPVFSTGATPSGPVPSLSAISFASSQMRHGHAPVKFGQSKAFVSIAFQKRRFVSRSASSAAASMAESTRRALSIVSLTSVAVITSVRVQ